MKRYSREIAVASALGAMLLALATLILKTYLEWRHHDAIAASGR